MPFTLHATWLRTNAPFPDGHFFFWAENADTASAGGLGTNGLNGNTASHTTELSNGSAEPNGRNGRARSVKIPSHPFQSSVGQLRALLLDFARSLTADALELATTTAWLPTVDGLPLARRGLLQQTGADGVLLPVADAAAAELAQWQLTGIRMEPLSALTFLSHLTSQANNNRQLGAWRRVRLGNDLLFWGNAGKVVLEVLVGQHYLPTLRSDSAGRFASSWQISLLDQRIERQVAALARVMPPVCRAYDLAAPVDAPAPAALLEHFVSALVDMTVRTWGQSELPQRADSAVQLWLYSLLTPQRQLLLGPQPAHEFYRDWRTWTEQLYVPTDANFRICFQLDEPLHDGDEFAGTWRLRFYLQARDNLALLIPAREIWENPESLLRSGNRRLDRPQERLLAGLGIASRLFAPIQRSLRSPQPEEAKLSTQEAHQFLREIGPLLESSGFGILVPDWWHGSKHARLGLRLRLLGEQDDASAWPGDPAVVDGDGDDVWLDDWIDRGLDVRYAWELTMGGERLTTDEFERLAAMKTPLVNMRGRWVELDPAQIDSAKSFLNRRQNGGAMSFLQSLRLAQAYQQRVDAAPHDELAPTYDAEIRHSQELLDDIPAQLPLESVDVEGWLEQVLQRLRLQKLPSEIAEPADFQGTLRPYQQRGVGWLDYLRRLHVGACLADDMGLGKTVQAIALMLHVRSRRQQPNGGEPSARSRSAPSLLICPTSVVANWKHEIDRFAPSLNALIHHGVSRLSGDEFLAALPDYDLIITSFGTARRDIDLLTQIRWDDLILDEAQNIKNPRAKQTQAIRKLDARNRMALTGTPVENHLAELWSIMEYLNPGYLGGYERFRKQYIVPIERYNDEERAGELRRLVQPFLLRRLKSDPTIISDLPEKNEMVVYCSLTSEQAKLYEQTVQQALDKLDASSGIQRRGLVLALVTKLKQITNHPAHFLRENEPLAQRSGKLDRLTEMLEEALSVGDRALVFTQFVEMGHLLQKHLRTVLDTDVLFLHGGISAKQRDDMVQFFQREDGPAVFVLSLRAGGSGLNLTQANHVFHFDRWWNPAVEDQATDRAFRIGQTRNVQVHKFVVAGTLEERINEMIESKQALAQAIVGSGEDWLTELDNDQLRTLLMLRREAV